MTSILNAIQKPILRGHFHQAAFFFSLGACALLLAECRDQKAVVSILVYSLSLCGLFGVSALYHRIEWKHNARMWMRRLDHAFIFILIAGTVTPICLLVLNEADGMRLLLMIWIAAAVGTTQALFWVKSPKWVSALLYIFVGWMALPYMPEIYHALGLNKLILILIGGVCYTLGAVIYAFKYPNPSPKYFGYHEIFHVLVIIAAAFHFLMIRSLVY
ncbi:MAG: hemolysin III family protein [Pseudobdellovibrio sp.]